MILILQEIGLASYTFCLVISVDTAFSSSAALHWTHVSSLKPLVKARTVLNIHKDHYCRLGYDKINYQHLRGGGKTDGSP
jgi:hypothetical protein